MEERILPVRSVHLDVSMFRCRLLSLFELEVHRWQLEPAGGLGSTERIGALECERVLRYIAVWFDVRKWSDSSTMVPLI